MINESQPCSPSIVTADILNLVDVKLFERIGPLFARRPPGIAVRIGASFRLLGQHAADLQGLKMFWPGKNGILICLGQTRAAIGSNSTPDSDQDFRAWATHKPKKDPLATSMCSI